MKARLQFRLKLFKLHNPPNSLHFASSFCQTGTPRGVQAIFMAAFLVLLKRAFLLWYILKGCSASIMQRNQLKKAVNKKDVELNLRSLKTVCCGEHPARVDEAATTQKMVNTPYVLEDASYPRLRLNLCLASTNNLEVLADAPLTTFKPYEKRHFVQIFLQLSTNLVLLKKQTKTKHTPKQKHPAIVLKLLLLTTLLYVAGCFLNGESLFGVTPGPAPSIWVSRR